MLAAERGAAANTIAAYRRDLEAAEDITWSGGIVVIGSGRIGKTSLCIRVVHQHFPVEYIPTSLEPHVLNIPRRGTWRLCDVAHHDLYRRFRDEVYAVCSVGLVCYDCTGPYSFEAVDEWLREIPEMPVYLVATKIDLEERVISRKQGEKKAAQIGALGYLEVSALTGQGAAALILQATGASSAEKRRQQQCQLQ